MKAPLRALTADTRKLRQELEAMLGEPRADVTRPLILVRTNEPKSPRARAGGGPKRRRKPGR